MMSMNRPQPNSEELDRPLGWTQQGQTIARSSKTVDKTAVTQVWIYGALKEMKFRWQGYSKISKWLGRRLTEDSTRWQMKQWDKTISKSGVDWLIGWTSLKAVRYKWITVNTTAWWIQISFTSWSQLISTAWKEQRRRIKELLSTSASYSRLCNRQNMVL